MRRAERPRLSTALNCTSPGDAEHRRRGFTKHIHAVFLTLVALLAALFTGEIALRAYHVVKARTVEQLRFIERDGRLGWKATADYQVRYRVRSGAGAEQTVTYSSVRKGFRVFGDVNSTRPKLLIIGDSFTQAVNMPTDKTYPALLSKALH